MTKQTGQRAEQPPPPPSFKRSVRLGPLEWIGVPLLAVLPALSLTGQFGPTSASASAASTSGGAALLLEVEHPLRIRHKASAELVVSVHNRGTRALEGLSIDIDEHYLSHFSRIEMLPAGSAVTPGRVHVDLPPLGANERARVRMRLEADDWGRQHGRIQLSQRRQDELAHLNFSTLVLP